MLLTACGGGSGPGLGAIGPPSAKSVAENSSDFPGLSKCPESGSYDNFLKAEKSGAPDQYSSDNKQWSDLKAAGVNDGYVVIYADNKSHCGQFSTSTPSGSVAYVVAFRFKDTSSASTNYKTQAGGYHISESDVTAIQAAGGTVKQGAATGLSDNAIVISIQESVLTLYVAYWQNKEFQAATLVSNLPVADASGAATKINGRIR